MESLFPEERAAVARAPAPLAERMRPRTFDEFVGQEELLAPGRPLREAIERDLLQSIILWGPPGTGKTTLARIIADTTKARFVSFSAVLSGIKEIRDVMAVAEQLRRTTGRRTILFIDEIHRFNKAQQDVLMPDVEQGNPILIGATTFNPFFAIVPALVSRSLVCEFKPLTPDDIRTVLQRALADRERGLGAMRIEAEGEALAHLAAACDGDARRALNALEVAALTTPAGPDGAIHVTRAVAEESIQKRAVVYDRDDDAHYDTISAFIKSMRGSDPDATLYWLAKMLYAGEDPRFIVRRIVICAAEDVGNADPQALVLAVAALQAAEFVGLPECRIPLAQAAVYVACAPKSNAAYLGIEAATKDVEAGRTLEVPQHLRDASYRGAKQLGRGTGYKYAHDFPGHHIEQEYLPAAQTSGDKHAAQAGLPERRRYYQPTTEGFEQAIKARLEALEAKVKEE